MPKLAAKDRKKVAKAEAVGGGFEPMAPGKYIAALSEVEAKVSGNGNPYWAVTFDEIHDLDGEAQPGRQWYNLMLPTTDTPPEDYKPGGREKDPAKAWAQYQALCAGRLKAFFEAFGYTEDSDTDEMIGDRAVIQVGIRTIQNGPRTGESTNEVKGVFSLDSVDFEDVDGDGDGDEF